MFVVNKRIPLGEHLATSHMSLANYDAPFLFKINRENYRTLSQHSHLFYDLGLWLVGFEHPTFSGTNALTNCATTAVI